MIALQKGMSLYDPLVSERSGNRRPAGRTWLADGVGFCTQIQLQLPNFALNEPQQAQKAGFRL